MRKVEEKSVGEEVSPLDEIARRGAQRMIEAALEVEVEQYVSQLHEHLRRAGSRRGGAQRPGAAADGDRGLGGR